jgi:hypothetical protein
MHRPKDELASPDEKPSLAAGTLTQAIYRSKGSTASERLLADLGEQAFLNLWSYPNLFYDKKQGGMGDGKELCDMLVVCGDDVIIFSDKSGRQARRDRVAPVLPEGHRGGGGTNQRRQQLDNAVPGQDIHRSRLHPKASYRAAAGGDQAYAWCGGHHGRAQGRPDDHERRERLVHDRAGA